MSTIDDLIVAEGAAAEEQQLPGDATAEHRNLGRSVMFSIRLNPDELSELESQPCVARLPNIPGRPAPTLLCGTILRPVRCVQLGRDGADEVMPAAQFGGGGREVVGVVMGRSGEPVPGFGCQGRDARAGVLEQHQELRTHATVDCFGQDARPVLVQCLFEGEPG
jgi:hypothetical protein